MLFFHSFSSGIKLRALGTTGKTSITELCCWPLTGEDPRPKAELWPQF